MAPPLRVVVAGGGPAALATIDGIRTLARVLVHLSVVAPETETPALRHVARAARAELYGGRVGVVDPDRGEVRLTDGRRVAYDQLVLAFVAPARIGWLLPLYELALQVGLRARALGLDVPMRLLTPEAMPLELFGTTHGATLRAWLDESGVTFRGATDVIELPGGVLDAGPERTLALHRGAATAVAPPRPRPVATPSPREAAGGPCTST